MDSLRQIFSIPIVSSRQLKNVILIPTKIKTEKM